MALAKDSPIATLEGFVTDFPVEANVKIYEGAVVGINAAGFARPFIASSTDAFFAGIAEKQADNVGGAQGAIAVKVRRDITYRILPLASAAQADLGDLIYASADDAFSKTSTNNLLVGRIHALVDSTKVVVKLEPSI